MSALVMTALEAVLRTVFRVPCLHLARWHELAAGQPITNRPVWLVLQFGAGRPALGVLPLGLVPPAHFADCSAYSATELGCRGRLHSGDLTGQDVFVNGVLRNRLMPPRALRRAGLWTRPTRRLRALPGARSTRRAAEGDGPRLR